MAKKKPQIETLVVGPLMTNCYIIGSAGEGAVIDAAAEPDRIKKRIDSMDLEVRYHLLTHGHLDHRQGLNELMEMYPAPLCYHEGEDEIREGAKLRSAEFGLKWYEFPNADKFLDDGDTLPLGDIEIQVLHTPGHSPGGLTFLIEGAAFTGDCLFAQGVGRTDFPGGDWDILMKSIKKKLYVLDDDTVIYPGHGPVSTIGVEKDMNPFVRML
jgi:glyoxylase-like metal-dependent hydrolase (beta-lactamase superfamily II)